MKNLDIFKEEYRKKGFLKINKFFKKSDIISVKNSIKKNINSNKNNHHFYYEKINNKQVLRRIEKISEFNKNAKKIILNKKIKKIINQLTKKKYKLFKEKLNFKYPGGVGFKPHIDGHFLWKDKKNKIRKGWSEYASDFLSIVIPLERVNMKNGCLEISSFAYTKKLGSNFKQITAKNIRFTPNIKKPYLKIFKWNSIEMEVGDILVFNWKCAHKSGKNLSSNSRMIFYATFYKTDKNKNIKNKYYLDKKNSQNPFKNKSLQ
tara:strand:+ start:5668 stop:6453 length:786 start_codon:yes stop_codon:yes gene_type:complete